MDEKAPLIILTGPTASGKTSVLLDISKRFPVEVVSADSMQVYRYMDIATAKPTAEEKAALPHHLIDIINPDEQFNAGRFVKAAGEAINKIRGRNKIPVIAGGTGLYIKAFLYGLSPLPAASARIRKALQNVFSKNPEYLWNMLCRLDPQYAKILSSNDAIRITRAVEIILMTGIKPSVHYALYGFKASPADTKIICILPERKDLYDCIDTRVVEMFDKGLAEETKNLLAMGYDSGLKSMQTLAYKHVISLLDGRIGKQESITLIQRDTRHYAKRQVTWFNGNSRDTVFCSRKNSIKIIDEMLSLTVRKIL